MTLTESAISYLDKNLSVIPIDGATKKPTIPWTEFQTRHATEDEIEIWEREKRLLGVAIVTGRISNITVVDCDSESADNAFRAACGDILLETPTAKTPRGGRHYVFQYDMRLITKAGYRDHVDVRNDGGYICAAPTVNGNGQRWEFLPGLDLNTEIMPMPESAVQWLLSGAKKTSTGEGAPQGKRHQTLIEYVGSTLVKYPSITLDELLDMAHGWNRKNVPPVTDAKDLLKMEKTVKSIFEAERENHPERQNVKPLNVRLDDYIELTNGVFKLKDLYTDLNIKDPDDRHRIRMQINRRVDNGTLDKIGTYDGGYKRIDKNIEANDWLTEAELQPSKLILPLGLTNLYNIYDGDLILVAGHPNAGKTAFTLNTCALNLDNFDVHFFNSSETYAGMFKHKVSCLNAFKDKGINWQRLFHYDRGDFFHEVMRSGPGNLNIIDYLEISDSFYEIGDRLAKIHQALKGAIAIVCVQQNPNSPTPLGGVHSLMKPSLAVSLSTDKDGYLCKVLKGKVPKKKTTNQNPSVTYHIANRVNFCGEGIWS